MKSIFKLFAVGSAYVMCQADEVKLMGPIPGGAGNATIARAIKDDGYVLPRVLDPDNLTNRFNPLDSPEISEEEATNLVKVLSTFPKPREIKGPWKVWSHVDSLFLVAYVEGQGLESTVIAVRPIDMGWQVVRVFQPLHGGWETHDYQSRTTIELSATNFVRLPWFISQITSQVKERLPRAEINETPATITIHRTGTNALTVWYFRQDVPEALVVGVGEDGKVTGVHSPTNQPPSQTVLTPIDPLE